MQCQVAEPAQSPSMYLQSETLIKTALYSMHSIGAQKIFMEYIFQNTKENLLLYFKSKC